MVGSNGEWGKGSPSRFGREKSRFES